MANYSRTQLGYFIDFTLWQDAFNLLKFQIEQKKSNRHFNTLSMFYYERLDVTCMNNNLEHYFDVKISTNLFYGLKKEFAVLPYVVPKPGLGLRDYKFFTYPMRVIYYAVGLYLLKLSQEFIVETYKKISTIEAFYGGNLFYRGGELNLSPKNTYFRSFHEKFKLLIKQETKSVTEDKMLLKLDIENYFNELSVSKLLDLLNRFIKPSIQANLLFDSSTRQQIVCLFKFISNSKSGIPQSDNNIISSFIGYLYLVFGDLFIDDILVRYKSIIRLHKIIRYTDDIYISITFERGIEAQDKSLHIHSIATQIAEVLYRELGLKLNLKTKLYRLSKEAEKDELLRNIRKASPSNEYFSLSRENNIREEPGSNTNNPQFKLDKIFTELKRIKNSKVEDYFIRGDCVQEEILQEVFNKSIESIINKPENKREIEDIFKEFNFNLIKVQPLEILIILLKSDTATRKFAEFCLKKTIVTAGDVDLIIRFLCQTGFNNNDLIQQLKKNVHMRDIIEKYIDNKVNCKLPGYYDLSCEKTKKLSEMPDVIEQTRLRIISERSASFSVALNHLLNEIHAVCIKQEQANKKNYDVNDVVKYLQIKGVQHSVRIKVRNLFDRRNSNRVSHPGSDDSYAWDVTKEEYIDYYENVGKCLDFLL